MSRRDPFSGRGPSTGNNRSHSLRATRRRWNVNLQWATLTIDGKKIRLRVSTKTLRTLRKAQKGAAPIQEPVVAAETVTEPVAETAAPAAAE